MSLTDSIDRLEAELGNRFDRLVRGLNDEIRRRIDQGQQEILRQLEQVSADLPAPLLSREDLDPLTAQARGEGFAGGRAEGRAAARAEFLEALRAFDAAGHQAELLDALLDQAARHASRTALFLARSAGARYWAGRGWGEHAALRNGLELAWEESAGWDRLAAGSGPIELRSAECASLCSRIESPLPREAVLIPLVLRDRVAAALYADRTDDGGALDLPALQALTFTAGLAIECLAFRERPATPTLAEAGAAVAALPLWDAAAEPPAASAATAGFVVEPEAEPEPAFQPAFAAAAQEPEPEPAPVEFAAGEPVPVEPAVVEPAPVEPAASGFAEVEFADVELAEADVVGEESETARIAAVDEEEVALDSGFLLESEPVAEPAPEVPWSYEPSREAWDAPAPATAAETVPGETAELSSAAIEDVWAGTSAIEDTPWPAAEPEPAAALEEAAPAEPAVEEAWPPMPEPAPAWPAEPTPAWSAAEPAPAPVSRSLSWSPVEEEIAPPPEYIATPEPEPEPEPAAAPPAVETVLLDRSAFAASLEAPPAPLPDEREETRPGLAGSAQVMPPSDFQGPGWAFATSRVQPAAAAPPTGGDDAVHEEARRLARLLVSEIRLYNEDQVEEGRRQRNLYDRLRDDIERSRQLYAERVDPRVLTAADYFDQELVRILAGGDAEALGR